MAVGEAEDEGDFDDFDDFGDGEEVEEGYLDVNAAAAGAEYGFEAGRIETNPIYDDADE